MLTNICGHCLQIFQIDDIKLHVFRSLEDDIDDTLLGIGKIENTGDQNRVHILQNRTYRMTLFPVYIKEMDREFAAFEIRNTHGFQTSLDILIITADDHARKITFDVSDECRNSEFA